MALSLLSAVTATKNARSDKNIRRYVALTLVRNHGKQGIGRAILIVFLDSWLSEHIYKIQIVMVAACGDQ